MSSGRSLLCLCFNEAMITQTSWCALLCSSDWQVTTDRSKHAIRLKSIIITLQLTSWYLYSFNLFKTPKIPLKVSTCYVLDLLKTRRCFVTPTRSVFLLFWITKTRNSLFKVPSKTPTGTLNIYIHIFSLWDKLYSQQNWPITVMKLKYVTIYAWLFF